MLATAHWTDHASLAFLPTIPSPLSPRSANIHGRRLSSSMTEKQPHQHSTDSENRQPFAKRLIKKAPSPRQDELKERRRGMFLKKVREGGQDKRFEARGEDIMRLDFMQSQRAWEAERLREAPHLLVETIEDEGEEDDVHDLPSTSRDVKMDVSSSQLPDLSQEEVDLVAQTEEEELRALLSYMPGEIDDNDLANNHPSDNLWSDDDDYDALFSEFMEQSGGPQQNTTSNLPPQDLEEEMDLS